MPFHHALEQAGLVRFPDIFGVGHRICVSYIPGYALYSSGLRRSRAVRVRDACVFHQHVCGAVHAVGRDKQGP